MTMPFWDLRDNALVTNNYIRLTTNHQGQKGAIWNKAVSLNCYSSKCSTVEVIGYFMSFPFVTETFRYI